jgi:hypothetical protein
MLSIALVTRRNDVYLIFLPTRAQRPIGVHQRTHSDYGSLALGLIGGAILVAT